MAIVYKSVQLPSDLLEALGDDADCFWSSPELEPVICDAIRAWLKRAPTEQLQPATESDAGYQWKQVFLPEGTKLRSSFDNEAWFATVEGGKIKYDRQAVSPSHFSNLRGSGNRNAWKTIWLRLPGSEKWLLADICRSVQRAAIARMMNDGATAMR